MAKSKSRKNLLKKIQKTQSTKKNQKILTNQIQNFLKINILNKNVQEMQKS